MANYPTLLMAKYTGKKYSQLLIYKKILCQTQVAYDCCYSFVLYTETKTKPTSKSNHSLSIGKFNDISLKLLTRHENHFNSKRRDFFLDRRDLLGFEFCGPGKKIFFLFIVPIFTSRST